MMYAPLELIETAKAVVIKDATGRTICKLQSYDDAVKIKHAIDKEQSPCNI